MIGAYINQGTFMPTYDNDDFSVKPALDANLHSKLKKYSTDYAKAILGNYDKQFTNNYRGTNFKPFIESNGYGPYYEYSFNSYWWLASQYHDHNPTAYYINSTGSNQPHIVDNVLGVVVCIR